MIWKKTSIPDELTYHEPAPHHAGEPRDALFMTARIVSLIFTPFHGTVCGILPAFFFTYLNIMSPAVQTDGFRAGVIASPSCYHAGIYLFQKSTAGHSTNWDTAKAFYPLRNDHTELHGLPADDVSHTPATLYERHHRSHPDLHGHLHSHQHTLENQHPHGQQRHDGGRITVLQLHLPVQSSGMALLLHPACRHVRFSPHHRQATYFK